MSSPDTDNTQKTPAEIELEDSLRSIRGVGESADGNTSTGQATGDGEPAESSN